MQANADAADTGAVIFDVESTELIERDVPLQRMEVSVACAVRVPDRGWTCRGRERQHRHVLARAGADDGQRARRENRKGASHV